MAAALKLSGGKDTCEMTWRSKTSSPPKARQRISVVVAGHVDHGKSTLIGRLLADTNNLPKGKLEAIGERCARAAAPLEYAHVLDALKDEQSRGMTIDSARCFFRTPLRDYAIIDVPGHVELLKNLVTGAARANAALLVVDAGEGVRDNTRRQGYMLAMLGVNQLAVCINKMDAVGYSKAVFDRVAGECRDFLSRIGLSPVAMAPVSARAGDNVVARCARMPWYSGGTVLDLLERLDAEAPAERQPLRLPVQDAYSVNGGRSRRILVGRIESGTIRVGDRLLLSPSGRRAVVGSINVFGKPSPASAAAGQSIGLTLAPPASAGRGELISRSDQLPPKVASRFRADLFWLGGRPAATGKRYVLKLATSEVPVRIERIVRIIDASSLKVAHGRKQVRPREIAECVLRTSRPVPFDACGDIAGTSRFVLVADYAVAGGGIVREAL